MLLTDGHTPLCRGLWEAVAATGARGPEGVVEHLLFHAGGNHNPPGPTGVQDLSSTGHQAVYM